MLKLARRLPAAAGMQRRFASGIPSLYKLTEEEKMLKDAGTQSHRPYPVIPMSYEYRGSGQVLEGKSVAPSQVHGREGSDG